MRGEPYLVILELGFGWRIRIPPVDREGLDPLGLGLSLRGVSVSLEQPGGGRRGHDAPRGGAGGGAPSEKSSRCGHFSQGQSGDFGALKQEKGWGWRRRWISGTTTKNKERKKPKQKHYQATSVSV
jgi:hypothetical protein